MQVYCLGHHEAEEGTVCKQCRDLLDYAQLRLENCPYDPKPQCKSCKTHCYKPQYREKVKTVMRFSGMHFVRRGRLDWLGKYFLSGLAGDLVSKIRHAKR